MSSEEDEKRSYFQDYDAFDRFDFASYSDTYVSRFSESTFGGNTIRKLVEELKNTDPDKHQEYEAYLNYITDRPNINKEVYFVRDYLDKDLVMKAHFDQNGYENQKKLMMTLDSISGKESMLPYRDNIVKIKELTQVRSSAETENKVLGYISIQQDMGLDYYRYLSKLKKPLNVQEIFSYIYQIVRGLSILNMLGLVHGDIKSNNLIIVHKEKPLGMRVIKVIDFGASKKIETTKTLSISVNVGTLRYEALEKNKFKKDGVPVDFKLKVDAWSLGIVIMETLLAGTESFKPFIDLCPQAEMNFEDVFFRKFLKESFGLLQKERGQQVELENVFFLAKSLLELDPAKRLDIYSALRFLKLSYNRVLNSQAAINDFINQQLELCYARRQGK